MSGGEAIVSEQDKDDIYDRHMQRFEKIAKVGGALFAVMIAIIAVYMLNQ